MAINLSKGQSIQLDKKNNLSSLVMGLGWDVGRPEKTGFFKSLLNANTKGSEFDLDGFAMLLDHDDRLRSDNDLIYFGNLSTSDQTIVHSGDNLTGEGEGDDEQITLQLGRIAERYRLSASAYTAVRAAGNRRKQGVVIWYMPTRQSPETTPLDRLTPFNRGDGTFPPPIGRGSHAGEYNE